MKFPEKIDNEEQLEELLSRPSHEAAELFGQLEGDLIFLGIAGKMGPSLAHMAARACESAGVKKRIIGVSRFSSPAEKKVIEDWGIEVIPGDLLNPDFIKSLPKVRNVFFLAGMKFGAVENLSLTWAVNSYMPAMIAEHFRDSRIAAFSTGCVYPLVSTASGGSRESDTPQPVGEYAMSCLGRERMFEYGSKQYNTAVTLIRLNYSVELRYGVLVDIAQKVKNKEPIDLSMGHFNVIWQGDANDAILRSIGLAQSPARILNITGEEILSVRQIAEDFGELFDIKPLFIGEEAKTALLSNASYAHHLFGKPKVPIQQVMKWIVMWMNENQRLLGKPTHYEVRDGKY